MVETARLIEAQISEVPVGFYVTGPFTLAGQIVGVQSLLMGMFKNPSGLLELLKSCTGTVVDYANQLKEAEIDFLVIADPTSSLISKRQFDDFSKPALARVVNAFSNDSVLHICGRSGHLLKQMVDTGAKGLSLDDNVKLTDATASVPKDVVIMGNYSPTKLAYESPETIRTEVRRMLDPLNGNGNVVASTGCDISASTPPANIHAFMRAVKTYARNSMTSQDSHVTCLGNR
jgi:MtaA/CmuA family methyltransferase